MSTTTMDAHHYAPYEGGSSRPYFSDLLDPQVDPQKAAQLFKYRLMVDARDRHKPSSTSPFDWQIFFDNPDTPDSSDCDLPRHITSIELKALCMGKVANEPYVIIDIPELRDTNFNASFDSGNKSFAVAFFETQTTGEIKPIKGFDYYQKNIMFDPPINRIEKLSVRLLKHDGNVVQLTDVANNSHVSILMELTCKNNRLHH